MKNYKTALFLIIFLTLTFIAQESQAALVGNTNQATLTASPQTGTYNINDNFQVSIYVNTGGRNIVVVAAYLNYDRTKFEAVSIDTTGSVFTMETEKVINSTNGTIKITRGIPSPGVNTTNGLVAKINFRATAATSPASDNLTFQFTAGATLESNVILDDGLGTDYLNGVYNGKYTVVTTGQCSITSVPNGMVAPYPSCVITCNTGYVLSGSSCVLSGGDGGGGGNGGITPPPKCIIDSDCYPSGFVLGKCGTFYTCSTDGKCYEGSRECLRVFVFEKPLWFGMKDSDVEKLQEFLVQDKSIYPEGIISGYYGELTVKAVQRFQCKYNIICQGTPETTGYGLVGPKTKAKLNEIYVGQIPIQTPIFSRSLYLGLQGDDIRKLQEFLAEDKSIYPEGLVTGYYGILTQKAVQRFQCKYNIVCSGDEKLTGYGQVGPKTRAKLNE